MSNSDIGVHGNDPEEVVRIVRNWLVEQAKISAPGPVRVWGAFNEFMADNYDRLVSEGYSNMNIEQLPANELISSMKEWVGENA